jgi:LacI family transcriptional regulator
MKNGSHVTINDIAKRLKVSQVTVSKALRGHPDISIETTKRVKKVAQELGYSPNFMARNLSARRSNMLGLVIPKVAHFFFGSVIEGVYNSAYENHYETILTVSQESAEREKRHLETLVSMRVDGIIISISQETHEFDIFKWIRKKGIPLLFIDRIPEPPLSGFSSVMGNDTEGTFMAIEHAIKIGYRKLGFIGGNTAISIGKNRLKGFRSALEEYGITPKEEWIIPGGFGKNEGYNSFKKLCSAGDLPEFVFAVTYPVALGIYEASKELGIQIPNDIDIMSYGDSDVSRFLSPALSCVRQPTNELGARAVQVMLETIADPDVTREHHVVLPTQLVIRETCATKIAQPIIKVNVDKILS